MLKISGWKGKSILKIQFQKYTPNYSENVWPFTLYFYDWTSQNFYCMACSKTFEIFNIGFQNKGQNFFYYNPNCNFSNYPQIALSISPTNFMYLRLSRDHKNVKFHGFP